MWKWKTTRHHRIPSLQPCRPLCSVSYRISSITSSSSRFGSSSFIFTIFCWFCWFIDFKEIASLIETGSYTKEVRRIVRAVRLTIGLRRKLTAPVLSAFFDFALAPGSEPHARFSAYLPKVHFCSFTLFCVFSYIWYDWILWLLELL